MRQYRFDVLGDDNMRLFGPHGKQVGQRQLSAVEIGHFVQQVEASYQRSSPDLRKLGKRLYHWLDGPSQRWLAGARRGTPGLAIHIDVQQRLRHLPWELLCEDGVFLCGMPNNPFTPVRRVGGVRRQPVAAANRPLRVLFMACSPEDIEPVLDFEAEEQRIQDTTLRQPVELAPNVF